MIEIFEKSEKFRKYIVELQFMDMTLYTVWGTDMEDSEKDKLLINNSRLATFRNLGALKLYIKHLTSPFLDKQNFESWIDEEDLYEVYSIVHIKSLMGADLEFLKDKATSLAVLDALNIINDFFIQLAENELVEIFDNPDLMVLKDFIYNNYFWKKEEGIEESMPSEMTDIINLLKKLYNDFYLRIEIIE